MKTWLVTGGIASGKSEVCRILRRAGYPVYDSDSRTKALYSSVPGLVQRVEEAVGVPFSGIGVIFEDERKRLSLEKVVFPEVLSDFRSWRSSQEAEVVFFESAIALDKELFRPEFDAVLLVCAPEGQRRSRNPKVAARLAAQRLPDPSEADFVIVNDGTLRELESKVENFIHTI